MERELDEAANRTVIVFFLRFTPDKPVVCSRKRST